MKKNGQAQFEAARLDALIEEIAIDANERRGLTAMCRRADGTNTAVAAGEVVVSPRTQGGRYPAA